MNAENWRDCDEWRRQKLPMNTTSNDACKLFDISLSQLIGYHDNQQYDGLAASLTNMMASDPDFILGDCLKTGIELLGSNAFLNSHKNVDILKQKSIKLQSSLTQRELDHVKAIDLLHRGRLNDAVSCWEDILIDNPTDILALKFSHSGYFYLGTGNEMRDSIARVLPYWNKSISYYNYLFGMYAFGLVESNQTDEARRMAMTGLDMCKSDAWATHAICHCNEYSGEYENGVKFLLETEKDWQDRNFIAEHNYWHLALFYLELNKQEEVTQVLEDHMMKTGSNLDMINSSSLLLRLKLDNETAYNSNNYLNDKYNKLKETYKTRIEEHGYLFPDIHIGIILSVCGTSEEKEQYFTAFKKHLNQTIEQDNYLFDLNHKIGTRLINAIFQFNENNYDEVVNLLKPIRYDIYKIGGSRAQKDLFSQILIHSALRSDNHKHLGAALVNERLALMNKSKLTLRIANKYGI